MHLSRRAARMERHHKRHKKASLNMVSLMDIFTILVFFLLFSSTEDVQVLPDPKGMTLPESMAEQRARETPLVMVTPTSILLGGELVADVAAVMSREAGTIEELATALAQAAPRASDDPEAREITIMGDRGLPYSLLRRVMATCTAADFERISLAVRQGAVVADARTAASDDVMAAR